MLAVPKKLVTLSLVESRKSDELTSQVHSEAIAVLELSYEDIHAQKKKIIEEYGIEEYKKRAKQAVWYSKSQLSFPDFIGSQEIRNNFHLFFSSGLAKEAYQSQEFYQRFARENPQLNKDLLGIFERRNPTPTNHLQAGLLYSAYCIMLSYLEVQNNADLFT